MGSDRERFAEAVAMANIPALLMVLVQLTGDERWLEPPFAPTRSMGVGDNDTGNLPEDVQDEIRAAALEAIIAWRDGRPVALPEPDEALLVRMLAVSMDEPVPDEYGPMLVSEVQGRPAVDPGTPDVGPPEGFGVVIIGAGVSGLCAGYALKQAGVPFTIVERNDSVGGIWFENRYPGAGVDTPNHLYSYSFAEYDWGQYFALRDELHAYLDHVASEYDLRPHLRLGTEALVGTYDEAAQGWTVQVRNPDGSEEALRCTVLISAVGAFNPPIEPDLPGLDSFAGRQVHTARWPDDVDLAGKHVAIVGTGASAMQTVPAIADDAASVRIFQRTPCWAVPVEHFQTDVPEPVRFLLREVPLYRIWYRLRLGWTFNDRMHEALQIDPEWPDQERSINKINAAHRRILEDYIKSELGDRQDLLEKVLPSYPPFGKRMLMDNGWFRTLTRDHVHLVTDAVSEIRPEGVATDAGEVHEADVLILSTGFDVTRFISTVEIRGRGGVSLSEAWDGDDGHCYLGTATAGFPNFFTLYGPNTQPGHGGSLIFILESQMHYLMHLLRQMWQQGIGQVEVRPSVEDAYNREIDKLHEHMIWAHRGMTSYYRNSRGRVVVAIPYRVVDFWGMTREADLDDYLTAPAAAAAPV